MSHPHFVTAATVVPNALSQRLQYVIEFDADGDNHRDFLVGAAAGSTLGAEGHASVLFGPISTTEVPPLVNLFVNEGHRGCAPLDSDGDGDLDIGCMNFGGVEKVLFVNAGARVFQRGTFSVSDAIGVGGLVVFEDIDGDSIPEAFNQFNSQTGDMNVLKRQNGVFSQLLHTTYTPPTARNSDDFRYTRLVDIDSDGLVELFHVKKGDGRTVNVVSGSPLQSITRLLPEAVVLAVLDFVSVRRTAS